MQEPTLCWICLEECDEVDRKCSCMKGICHTQCLARWQMRCCGKQEEKKCSFCGQQLIDWKQKISPAFQDVVGKRVVIKINFGGSQRQVSIKGKINPDRLIHVISCVLKGGSYNIENAEFTVNDPFGDEKIIFKGFASISAVVYCALLKMKRQTVENIKPCGILTRFWSGIIRQLSQT